MNCPNLKALRNAKFLQLANKCRVTVVMNDGTFYGGRDLYMVGFNGMLNRWQITLGRTVIILDGIKDIKVQKSWTLKRGHHIKIDDGVPNES